jgi:hypothetical protein
MPSLILKALNNALGPRIEPLKINYQSRDCIDIRGKLDIISWIYCFPDYSQIIVDPNLSLIGTESKRTQLYTADPKLLEKLLRTIADHQTKVTAAREKYYGGGRFHTIQWPTHDISTH